MIRSLISLILALFAVAPLAAQNWHRAESPNYVVHAKLDADHLRELVERIERFDALLQSQLPPQARPGRKMHIFLQNSMRKISRVAELRFSGISFASPELSGSYSLYDRSADPRIVMHPIYWAQTEYYISNAYFRPNPYWVRSGVPAFFATALTDQEGAFILGAPGPFESRQTSAHTGLVRKVLETNQRPDSQSEFRQFFNLGRDLATVLLIDPAHTGLLENHIDAYSSGRTFDQAIEELGDLEALAKQMRERQTSRTRSMRRVDLPEQAASSIDIRRMQDDEIAVIELRVQRLLDERRARTARGFERLTRRFPDSALVWYEYAASEFALVQESQFGGEPVFRGFGFSNGELIVSANLYSDAAAWRAVNRALELDPGLESAIRLKAEILLSRQFQLTDQEALEGFEAIRAMLGPLTTDPEGRPLAAALLFQSYIEQGLEPPADALDLLGRAFVSNAGVREFRYAYAVALKRRGEADVASRLLTSMLNDNRYGTAARRALEEGS